LLIKLLLIKEVTVRNITWLEFENDEKLNAFMRFTLIVWLERYSTTGFSRIGGGFSKREIEIAKRDFGAKVIEKPV